jgi:Ca-activated chloride channel homolog
MNAATFALGEHWPLWLLTALPVLAVAAWRHRSPLGRGRMLAALLLRSAALALLALALARPELHRGIRDVSLVYALDVSRSVSPAFLRSALDWIQEANRKGNPAQVRYVAFADRAVMVDSIAAVESLAVSEGGTESANAHGRSEPRRPDRSAAEPGGPATLDQGATNLERALATSLAGFAPGHALRLVLISDGNQTEGDLWRVVPRLRRQGVRVFGVPAAVAVTRDAWVEGIEATDGIRQREPATVKVRVFSRLPGPARIELKVAGVAAGAQDVTLTEGRNEFVFGTEFKQAGRNTIEARVAAEGDQVPDNDTLTQLLWVGERPRVLYVESTPASARYLRDALVKQGIDVTVVAPAALAADPPPYHGHDAVLLSDLPADAISDASARRLDDFVRDGGALLFAAGENTFGQQGFRRGTIEGLLPVSFEGRRKKKELDLVLLIDRSHSMSGKKLEFAKTAALSTLDLLEEQHRLAVIAFDARPHEVVPLAEVGNKRRAEDQIAGMAAGGQTSIFNALVHARRLLKDSPAKTKHVILLSDGQTMPAGRLDDSASAGATAANARGNDKPRQATPYDRFMAEQPTDDGRGNAGFEEIATRMAAENVTISTVTLGEQPNLELMQSLARWGRGKSQVAASETEIPSLFVGEARRLMRESIVEEPFRPVVKTPAEALAGLQFAKAPPLNGFVVGRAKPFSETLLEAKDGQPLLVQTHHGLGRTVAFLSDVKNRWAADWLGWDGYGKLWAQLVRASIRRDTGEELALRVAREGHEAIVTLTALEADGRYRDRLSPKLRVTAPDGGHTVLAMSQLGPGRYQARVPLWPSQAAPYGFELIETAGITAEQLAKASPASLFYGHTDEYRVLPADESLLRAVSVETGGRFMPKAEEIFAVDRDSGQVSRALWQFCAAAALLAFLLDLLVRRTKDEPDWHRA